MRDVTVGQVADAVVTIDFYYEEGETGPFTPIVRDIEVRNVTSRKSRYGLFLRGYAHDRRSPTSASTTASSRASPSPTSSSPSGDWSCGTW